MNSSRLSPIALLALATLSQAATPVSVAPAATAPAAKPVTTSAAPATAVPATPAAQATKIDSLASKDLYRFSYAIGADIGASIKQIDYKLDQDLLVKGLLEALNKDASALALSKEQQAQTLQDFQATMMKLRAEKDSIASLENSAKAKAFLEKNKKVKGVVTTKSGLQYSYIKKGTGASPKATDKVTAHYVGTLLDGTEFDSSVKRGEPATFPLANVIKGWQEMLPLMKIGDKVKCWIPAELGYGAQGNAMIPANSMLVFEVELLAIPATQP